MSETWLHGIERWGKGYCPIIESYDNSHGTAPVVWNFMAQRYANADHYFDIEPSVLWKLAYRDDIPVGHRNVMRMTYDRAIILQKDAKQAARDIEHFLENFPLPSNMINHWAQISEDIEKHSNSKKYLGFGFCMTTIGETFFQGEEYKKRHHYKHHKIQWKADGFFSVYPL